MKLINKILLLIIYTVFGASLAFGAVNSTVAQISKIENSIWGFEYSKDTTLNRLSRIEKNVFGTTNTKLSEEARIKKLVVLAFWVTMPKQMLIYQILAIIASVKKRIPAGGAYHCASRPVAGVRTGRFFNGRRCF